MTLKIEYFEVSNSAGRLWKILNGLKSRSGGEVYTQLGQILGIEPGDPVAYMAALSALISALDSVDRQVRAVPDVNHPLHLHALPHLRGVLGSARQNQNFDQFKAQLFSQDSLTCLMFCADLLGKTDPEDEIPPDELKSLLEDISHLYESILTSTLPKPVKALILDQLENIRRAVHEYRVRGVRALKEALATAVGQVHLHAEELKNAKSDTDRSELSEFAKVLNTVDTLVSVATKAQKLLAPILPYLPLILPK
jgi:hypothetical protein